MKIILFIHHLSLHLSLHIVDSTIVLILIRSLTNNINKRNTKEKKNKNKTMEIAQIEGKLKERPTYGEAF